MGKSEAGSAGRAFVVTLIILVIIGLGGVVIYLLSDINHRNYRLAAAEGTLVVERGRMLPFGYSRFQPSAADLQAAYSPVAIPPGENLGPSEIYTDRADIDRALFSLLASWARERLTTDKAGDFELAAQYVRRCELLPGLSEEQRVELRTMRADLAYRNGRRILGEVVERLKKARDEFGVAKELGTSRPQDVDAWIGDVERRIRDYQAAGDAPTVAPPAPATTPPPADGGLPETPAPQPEKPGDAQQPKWRL